MFEGGCILPYLEWCAQCELVNGNSKTIGWIPIRAAKVGNMVELKDYANDGLWQVTKVGIIMERY